MVLFGSGSETRVYPSEYEFTYKREGNAPTDGSLASPLEWLLTVVKVGAVSALRHILCAPLDLIARTDRAAISSPGALIILQPGGSERRPTVADRPQAVGRGFHKVAE